MVTMVSLRPNTPKEEKKQRPHPPAFQQPQRLSYTCFMSAARVPSISVFFKPVWLKFCVKHFADHMPLVWRTNNVGSDAAMKGLDMFLHSTCLMSPEQLCHAGAPVWNFPCAKFGSCPRTAMPSWICGIYGWTSTTPSFAGERVTTTFLCFICFVKLLATLAFRKQWVSNFE